MKSTNQPGKVAIGGAHGYGSRLSAVTIYCEVTFILGSALHTSYYSITILLQSKSSRDAYHLWTQNPYTFHTWRVAHLTQNGAGSLLRGGRAWTFRSSGALASWRDCRIDIYIYDTQRSCYVASPLMKGIFLSHSRSPTEHPGTFGK